MHRTEGTDHIGNLFSDGPPGTKVEEDWLNAVQEEIADTIESAGFTLKTASTDSRDQLRQAIIHHGATDFFGLEVSYNDLDTVTISPGFTIDMSGTGWMSLAASVTLNRKVYGVGGLDHGTPVITSVWYCAYLIKNPSTGSVDGILSRNPYGSVALTTPAPGYTMKRLVGFMFATTAGIPSGDIRSFREIGKGPRKTYYWHQNYACLTANLASNIWTTVSTATYAPPISMITELVCVHEGAESAGAIDKVVARMYGVSDAAALGFTIGYTRAYGPNTFAIAHSNGKLEVKAVNGGSVIETVSGFIADLSWGISTS